MRTDIIKVTDITVEEELNDRLYNKMQAELNSRIFDYYCDFYDYEEAALITDFEKLYFMRRILSVLRNHDLPLKPAIGLYAFNSRLDIIELYREDYLDDEDSDIELFDFLIELGYRFYDIISEPGDSKETVLEKVETYHNIEEEVFEAYVNRRFEHDTLSENV